MIMNASLTARRTTMNSNEKPYTLTIRAYDGLYSIRLNEGEVTCLLFNGLNDERLMHLNEELSFDEEYVCDEDGRLICDEDGLRVPNDIKEISLTKDTGSR